MAESRPRLYKPRLKRFKACKIRVNTKSTSGKKITRNVRVRAENFCRHGEGAVVKNSPCQNEIFLAEENDMSDGVEVEKDAKQDRVSKYLSRRVKEYSSWEGVRQSLLQARLQEEAFSSDTMCIECCNSFAVCRCMNCGPRQYFCMDCASVLHEKRNYFHVLETFKDGSFVPLMVNHAVLALDHQRKCSYAEKRNIICIDQWGHQHEKSVLFCACEKDAVTLLKLHLWPGSISRPLVAFHFNLVTLAELFLLECHVSLRKFCDVLGLNKSTMLPRWIKDVYKILNNDSFDEFRYHQYLMKSMKEVNDQLSETICPLCPQNGNDEETQNIVIESMDGCFGLLRKKSAGTNLLPPRHGTIMFADQEHVDEFVLEYSKDAKEAPGDCNEFKSGEVNNMLRSKGRNALFDEKGVFGRVCRHEYPKGFISMKHGERIAYSVFEVDRLLSNSDATTNVKIMYDIGCTLSAHLKKNNRQDILDRIDLAIPMFHCYGHKSSCQLAFGPRRKSGYGLTDGEGIERLWSYLRGFSSITKEMTCGRRIDILTDALLHYAQKRLQQFGPSFISNLRKAKNLMENAMEQLQEVFSKLTVEYDNSLVKSWIEEEQNVLLTREKTKVLPLSWEAKYVQNLFQLEELRHNIAATESDKHDTITDLVKKRKATLKAIVSTEKSQKLKQRWKFGEAMFNSAALTVEKARRDRAIERIYALAVERMFLLSLKQKYADGQAIAAKLSKQITQRTNAIKVSVEKYNAALSSWKEKVEGMPETLKFDDVKDPQSGIFADIRGNSSSQNGIPFSVKRNVIDLYHLIERCKEEVSYLNVEMIRLVKYYENRISMLERFLASHMDDTSVYIKGVNCVVRKQIREENNKLYALGSILSDNLPIEVQSSLPQFECTFEATKPLNEISSESEELEMVYSDSDNDIDEEEYEEELALVLDLSDDEECA